MAQLILENINPKLVQMLEERARQLGTTVQAEVSRLLEAVLSRGPGFDVDGELEGNESARMVQLQSGACESERTSGQPTLADRQAALADQYPDEYVVLRGEQVIAHTPDKQGAFALYDSAIEEVNDEEAILIPPAARRRISRPIVRGRALAGAFPTGTK
jgi:hypothetical protein